MVLLLYVEDVFFANTQEYAQKLESALETFVYIEVEFQ